MATFVALLEIVGGILLISGLFYPADHGALHHRDVGGDVVDEDSDVPRTSPLPLPPAPPKTGVWAVLHEIRSEYAQLMSVTFVLIAGPGPWSIDALVARKRHRELE
jgi:hypothetical protein